MRTLKSIREQRGLTQQQMADLCRVHLRTYQRWEATQKLSPKVWLNVTSILAAHF